MMPLRILVWNANGVSTKLLELDCFVRRHNIDVLLLSETHGRGTGYPKLYGQLEQSLHLNIEINSGRDIEDAIDFFTDKVKSAAKMATRNPPRKPAASGIPLTYETRLLIAEKRRLRLRWMRSRHPLDKAEWNRAQAVLKRALADHKAAWFDERLANTGTQRDATHQKTV
ncbi:hypothetical protein KR018_006795 [Drosophila ironensis]|nr:hypothetical protein KR018_006795 [Drosophila ironensis]